MQAHRSVVDLGAIFLANFHPLHPVQSLQSADNRSKDCVLVIQVSA